jgi:hypothetical protein
MQRLPGPVDERTLLKKLIADIVYAAPGGRTLYLGQENAKSTFVLM